MERLIPILLFLVLQEIWRTKLFLDLDGRNFMDKALHSGGLTNAS
jgi:hypothetical protein